MNKNFCLKGGEAMFKFNTLLDYFQVKNHQELLNYITENPNDSKVKELKEILHVFKIHPENKEENDG